MPPNIGKVADIARLKNARREILSFLLMNLFFSLLVFSSDYLTQSEFLKYELPKQKPNPTLSK